MPTTPPTLTPTPTPAPQRGDSTTFSSRVDAFITWLTNAVTQFNSLATNVYNNSVEAYNAASTAILAPGTNATSTTSMSVSIASKSFTIQTDKQFVPGMFVVIAQTSAPTTNSMYGQISAYTIGTGAIIVNVTNIIGTGTNITDWTISLSGGASLVTNNTTNNTSTYLGFKNKIRNSEYLIDQLYVGAAQTPSTSIIALDGWGLKIAQAAKITFQQVADAPVGGFNSAKLTVAASYNAAAAETFAWYQRIEGIDCIDLAYGTASAQSIALGFWAKASVTGTYSFAIKNSAGARVYIGTYTISVANTWQQFSYVIAGDTTGTWLTGTGVQGLGIYFDLGCGTSSNGTAGAWSAGNLYNTSGSIKFVSQANGSTLFLTQVELFKSTVVPTAFERLPYAIELARAQRYVEKSYDPLTAIGAVTNIGAAVYEAANEGGVAAFPISFDTVKAVTPLVTWYNPSSGASTSFRNVTGAVNIGITGTSASAPISTKQPGLPTYTVTGFQIGIGDLLSVHWKAIAEIPGA